MTPDPDASAADRILFLLKTDGPMGATALAERLEVTPVAVRQQLARLEQDDLVTWRAERRPVGRPAHVYRLTTAAHARFPDSHADLAVDLLDATAEVFGPEGVARLLAARARSQRQRYLEHVDRDADLPERVAALCALRAGEGYMAEVVVPEPGDERDEQTLWLVENHCPVCAAADRCRALCKNELELFREVLGDDVQVERTEHLLAGARRCVYRIAPRAERAAR